MSGVLPSTSLETQLRPLESLWSYTEEFARLRYSSNWQKRFDIFPRVASTGISLSAFL